MELAGLQVDLAGLRRLHPTIMQKMAEVRTGQGRTGRGHAG